MEAVEVGAGEVAHADVWRALTGRLGVVVGTLTALTALIHDAPVSRASLRGGFAFLAVMLLGRACEWLQRKVHRPPAAEPDPDTLPDEAAPPSRR